MKPSKELIKRGGGREGGGKGGRGGERGGNRKRGKKRGERNRSFSFAAKYFNSFIIIF